MRVESSCSVAVGLVVPHFSMTAPIKAIDIDRCVLKTGDCVGITLEAAEAFGMTAEETAAVCAAQAAIEQDGGSFEPLSAIKAALPTKKYMAFGDFLLKSTQAQGVYPDAARLQQRLWRPGDLGQPFPHYYATWGVSPLWQGVKAPMADCHGLVVITRSSDKGPLMDELEGPSGTDDLIGVDTNGTPVAVFHAPSQEIVDDKTNAVKSLSRKNRGKVLWRRDEKRLPSQGTEIPPAVADRTHFIYSLDEVDTTNAMHIADCQPQGAPSDQHRQPVAFLPARELKHGTAVVIRPGLGFAALQSQLQ